MTDKAIETKYDLDELFKNGVHFGFVKSRRHPSTASYIFGSKNRLDIFDLEKTSVALEKATEFVTKLATNNSTILFIGGKNEARDIVRDAALSAGQPYVASRWIGGTLTNFSEIRKRVDTMIDLLTQKEKGELVKYTKKERLLIDRKVEKLQKMYGGIVGLTSLPKAVFIVDPRFEHTAFNEAKALGIPVIALCGSDNNITNVDFPIPANDSNRKSIKYCTEVMKETYIKAKKSA